jgi:hypothetical protein
VTSTPTARIGTTGRSNSQPGRLPGLLFCFPLTGLPVSGFDLPGYMSIIKPRTDAENREFIERCHWLSATGSSDLLRNGTPDTRARWVRSYRLKRALVFALGGFFLGALALAAFTPPAQKDARAFLVQPHLPRELPAPAETVVDGGFITTVEMHDTPSSWDSTITTTVGVLQVAGAVSAEVGDKVTIKQTPGAIRGEDVCVASRIKTACYRLL